ncbi:MAG: response regulator transcription factor [Chitinophagaceae bacterium]|nr:response regulator transcription factor [Chitinophagaceae bacterium]MCW5904602.1 response regulator transcription factor [Chitinophagaceae bacterium]
MKILIAEDEPLMATALEKKLISDGHIVLFAPDGRVALELLKKELPDLIITDIMMPYTSGLELISIVRSDSKSKIPIIVLSGMGEEDTVLQAFELGADDFIIKPFNPSELSVRVKRFEVKLKKMGNNVSII